MLSLPEVAGDAAQLLPADDTGAWAEAMTRLAQDPERRQHMQERARMQAARFDWRRGAADLLSLYEEAATATKRNASCQPH